MSVVINSQTTVNASYSMYGSNFIGAGQAFTVEGTFSLDKVAFYLSREGTLTGNVVAKLYDVTGTPAPYDGSTEGALPTGNALATSASVSANSITTALPWNANPTEFTFDGTYILRDGYSYAFVFEYGDSSDSSNSLRFGTNNTSTLREDENILIKALNSPGLSDGWHGYMPMGSDDMGYLVYGEEIEQTPTIGVKYPLPAFKR